MKYKEITFLEAMKLFIEVGEVYYTYHTNPNTYRYIGSLGLDHARRNQDWYKYYIEDTSSKSKIKREE